MNVELGCLFFFERKGKKNIEHENKSVCFGCSRGGPAVFSENTTRPFPDSTNRLVQQVEPEKHKGNIRTYHISPERSRKTPNRPWTHRCTVKGSLTTFQFPQPNTSTPGTPDHRASSKKQQKKDVLWGPVKKQERWLTAENAFLSKYDKVLETSMRHENGLFLKILFTTVHTSK